MTYTNIVKEEILQQKIENIEYFYAELFGILISKKAINNMGIVYTTEKYQLAQYLIKNIRKFTDINLKISYIKSKRFKEHKEYTIEISENDKHYEKFIYNLLKYKSFDNIQKEDIGSYIIRGFFLATAYIKHPNKGYYLDFFIDHEDSATFLYMYMKNFIPKVGMTTKGNKSIVYIRNNECILDILNLIQAQKSFFYFQEIVIEKENKNNIIRAINYEIANEVKKMKYVNKSIEEIEYIDKKVGLHTLNSTLQEYCKYRLEYRELSLQELANKIGITKSGLRSRINRLSKIYDELKNK